MLLAALMTSVLPDLSAVGKVLVFLVMLSVLVVLHELGHFIVARVNGVRVNDFALGMGPTLLKWTSPRTGTNYRVNLFPIGGYCAMQGEDGKTSEAEQQRRFRTEGASSDGDSFQAKRPLRRLSIVAAGPIANFIVAFTLLAVVAVGYGTQVPLPTVGALQPNMPAQRAGLQPGDTIVKVGAVTIESGSQLVDIIHASANKPLTLTVRRGNATFVVHATPQPRELAGKRVGLLGFAPKEAMQRASLRDGLAYAGLTCWIFLSMQVGVLAGPVGIAAMSGQVQSLGWGPYLMLAAQISISLGIFNFLPIPALDGGRGAFIVAELLRGKPVDPEKEAFVHFAGFAALMMLMVFVTYHDIVRLVAGRGTL